MKRKAELEERLRERELERERRAKLQQARIDRLLDEAGSLRRAADIRAYVVAVRQALEVDGTLAATHAVARGGWTLAQADRIDPVKNGKFLQELEGDGSSDE